MKKRVISAIIMLIILVPLILAGGMWFNVGLYLVSILALKEFLDVKASKKPIPSFIRFIAYVFLTLLMIVGINSDGEVYTLDYKLLTALVILFLFPTVLYHERKKYSINDAFYLIGGLLFLGISMSLLILVRSVSLNLLIFLLLIPMATDIFAYITGLLIGKHKLLEEISPKKTVEGMIGGTIMGVFIGAMFDHTVIDPMFSKIEILAICTFLSLLGQYGDLVFSAIKRYFGKKDFSHLIPGHGGILDRLDSIIFVLLGFMFFITIL